MDFWANHKSVSAAVKVRWAGSVLSIISILGTSWIHAGIVLFDVKEQQWIKHDITYLICTQHFNISVATRYFYWLGLFSDHPTFGDTTHEPVVHALPYLETNPCFQSNVLGIIFAISIILSGFIISKEPDSTHPYCFCIPERSALLSYVPCSTYSISTSRRPGLWSP